MSSGVPPQRPVINQRPVNTLCFCVFVSRGETNLDKKNYIMKLQLLEYVGPETADDRSNALKRSSSQPPGPRPLSPPHLCELCVFVLMHVLFCRVFLRGHVKFGFKLKIRTRSNRVMSRRGTGGLYHIYNTKKQANKLFKCHIQANNKLVC